MVVVPARSSNGADEGPAGRPVETLIVDRQPLFLAALGSLLSSPPLGAHVIAAVRSDTALEIIRCGGVDLVCCELHAEPISGLELARILAEDQLSVPMILLGDAGDEAHLASALGASIAGFFTKSSDPTEFIAGVKAVRSGHRAIGSAVIGQMLTTLSPAAPHEYKRFSAQLSPTEIEILSMIGRAQSIPTIAASRGISHKTVRNHLAKIYRKLELHGKTEAVLWAARMGLTGN